MPAAQHHGLSSLTCRNRWLKIFVGLSLLSAVRRKLGSGYRCADFICIDILRDVVYRDKKGIRVVQGLLRGNCNTYAKNSTTQQKLDSLTNIGTQKRT